MPRTIITSAGERTQTDPIDGYKERLLKYIPAGIITLYMALSGIVGAATGASTQAVAAWVVFGIALLATPTAR